MAERIGGVEDAENSWKIKAGLTIEEVKAGNNELLTEFEDHL